MSCNRRSGYQIFFAELGLLSEAFEMTLRAVALDTASCPRMSRMFVAESGLVDREGIVVGAGRDLSRLVVH